MAVKHFNLDTYDGNTEDEIDEEELEVLTETAQVRHNRIDGRKE